MVKKPTPIHADQLSPLSVAAEIERLQQRLKDAGAFTLSERWAQQEAEIERLRAEIKHIGAERLIDNMKTAEQIVQLEAENAELLEALKMVEARAKGDRTNTSATVECAIRAAIARAEEK